MNKLIPVILSIIILTSFIPQSFGLGLIWEGVSKTGSKLTDIADVAGCDVDGSPLKYQTSNGTWICGTDNSGSGIASINQIGQNASIIQSNSTTKATFKNISDGNYITWFNNTSSLIANLLPLPTSFITNLDTSLSTFFSNISPTNSGNFTLIGSNSTPRLALKTLSQGTGILITNDANNLVISSTVVDTDTGFTNISSDVATANNATLIMDNSTSSTRVSLKTISNGFGISLTNNTNSVQINMTNPIMVMTGANLTSTTTASYLTIFDIPLTANRGNNIQATLIQTGEIGAMGQYIANYTTSNNNWGNCLFQQPSAATTLSIDFLPIHTLGQAITDTGGTTQANANATSILINCSILAGSNPGSVKINFQTSATNSAVHILNGSWYVKTP